MGNRPTTNDVCRDGGHDGVEGLFLLIEGLVPRRPRMPNG